MYKLPGRAQMIGADELLSEALSILTECALPPQQRVVSFCHDCGGPMPEGRRVNAKYCSPACTNRAGVKRYRNRAKGNDGDPVPAAPKTHIGSMWQWPDDQMLAYAIREVGFRLCHFVSTGRLETPASQIIANLSVAEDLAYDAIEIAAAWLEANGVVTMGSESVEELLEAVAFVKARTVAA
jgi:hypothetical protein